MSAFEHIQKAKFISTGKEDINAFSGFLREFQLQAVPQEASLAITADTHYKLYVNGRFVNAGPAPFRRPAMRVDEYDISGFLAPGLNRVFVITRFIGTDVKYNCKGTPGLVAVIVIDGDIIPTDERWSAYKLDAWQQDAPKITWALPPMECVDLASPSYGLISRYAQADYAAPQDGENVPVLPVQAQPCQGIDFVSRGVPLLRWQEARSPLLKQVFRTSNEVHNLRDTPLRMEREHMEPAWDVEACKLFSQPEPVLCRARGEPGYALLYDVLRTTAGDFSVELEADQEAIVEMGTAEKLLENGRPFVSRNGSYYVTRLHLAPGLNRFRLYAFTGFRYLFLVAKDFEGQLKVNHVRYHECAGDFHYQDCLELNDRAMNAIQEMSRRSVRLAVQAGVYDCNTREHGSYWGDGLWVTDMLGHMSGDFSQMRELCRAMTGEYAANATLNSSLYGLGRPLIDYCMLAVEVMRRYALYTNDRETVSSHFSTCESIMADFREARDDEGFVRLENLQSLKPEAYETAIIFLDHPGLGWHARTTTGISRREPNAGLNLSYLLALQAMREMRAWLKKKPESLDEEIQQLRTVLKERFFDPQAGLMGDALAPDGQPEGFSQIVNALAVITGVLQDDAARRALCTVTDIEQHPRVSQGTPYSYFYLVEALGRSGLSALAYAELRNRWLPMLQRGATTTWETFLGENHDSLHHAWSAPLPYFARRWLAGIHPLEPGYASVGIRPALSVVDCARITAVIPQGRVEVQWATAARSVITVEIVLPVGVSGQYFCEGKAFPLRPGKNAFTANA